MCVNSWGNDWGKEGRFKIDPQYVDGYVIPGEVEPVHGSPFPLPLPNSKGGVFVWTGGFKAAYLNEKWVPITKNHENDYIGGKRTLWNILRTHVMYYCGYKKKWTITSRENFPKLKDGHCYWDAMQGDLCHGLLDFDCDWKEYD